MKIEFVNHASFIVDTGDKRLICDPWLWGSAFDQGWDHVTKTILSIEDFSSVDYIWYSHEHPDHFSPETLKTIPEEARASITVIYRKTLDRKVLGFVTKLGFATLELTSHERVQLGNDFHVTCGQHDLLDSWLLLEHENKRILNINDCPFRDPKDVVALKKKLGTIDVLFTQFSYAGWKGGKNGKRLREQSAQFKLNEIRDQVSILKPQYCVPFASFIYFSHEDNKFLNDSVNTPQIACKTIEENGAIPVLLYPGEQWKLEARDNQAAFDQYDIDFNLDNKPFHTTESISLANLQGNSKIYLERMHRQNNRSMLLVLKNLHPLNLLSPVTIYLTDHDMTFCFDYNKGLRETPDKAPDVAMHSESLDYIFRFDWGFDTLVINGRFSSETSEGLIKLTKLFGLGTFNNTGKYLSISFLFRAKTILNAFRVLRRFSKRMDKAAVTS